MSTRRSTRASSRGTSPALSELPPTPARRSTTRRSGNGPLPSVNVKASTAYGTNTIPAPGRFAAPQTSDQVGSVLAGLLEPVPEDVPAAPTEASSSRRSARGAKKSTRALSDIERSYNNESKIFNTAGIESSSVADPSDLYAQRYGNVEEEEEEDDEAEDEEDDVVDESSHIEREKHAAAERHFTERQTRQHLPTSPAAPVFSISRALSDVKQKAISIPWLTYLTPVLIVLLFTYLLAPATSNWTDFKHNIGQYFPPSVSRSGSIFQDSDVNEIYRRLDHLDDQVALITRTPDIEKSIKRIEDMLPEFLAVKKDKFGQPQIPEDFWSALHDRILKDETLISQQIDSGSKGTSSGTGLSAKQVGKEVDKHFGKNWENYLKTNEAKIKTFTSDEITRSLPKLLEGNSIADKKRVLEMIRDNWDRNVQGVKSELIQHTTEIDQTAERLSKLSKSSVSRLEVRKMVEDVIRHTLPDLQLDALAKSNMKNGVQYGLEQFNHFSPLAGATVDATLTSPNYVFPSQNVWFPMRWYRAAIGNAIPPPNPPSTALKKWNEFGECWCSPASDSTGGFGSTISVMIGHKIYPERIVVEHIKQTVTLEPGSTPREMELFAEIDDPAALEAAKARSTEYFRTESEVERQIPKKFVRIATWMYDTESYESTQSFGVQLDLKSLGASTNKLVVRAKNNWGGDELDYTCLYRVRLNGEVAPANIDESYP